MMAGATDGKNNIGLNKSFIHLLNKPNIIIIFVR